MGEGFKVKDDKSVRRKEGSKNGDFRSDIHYSRVIDIRARIKRTALIQMSTIVLDVKKKINVLLSR